MKVRILNISYKNIRGVNNLNLTFERNSNAPYPVTLLMMPNGTGKTTTMSLLRAIFDGQARNWDTLYVKQLKPSNSSSVKTGEFRVKLLINDSVYYVVLNLDYDKGFAWYQTSSVGEFGGLEDGLLLPSVMKDMFTEEFVKRFIFDGELAKEIIDSKSDEAEDAIKYLYKLNRLEELQIRVSNIVKEAQKQNQKTSARTETGLSRLQNEMLGIKTILDSLIDKKNTFERDIQSKKMRLEEIDKIINKTMKENDNINEQVEELEQKLNDNKISILNNTKEFLDRIRKPYLLSFQVAKRLEELSAKMHHLKLPKTTSRQFFEELAESPRCICDREIGAIEKNKILKKAKEYLAEDQIGVINAVKSDIRDIKYNESLKNLKEKLKPLIDKRRQLKTDWDRLSLQIEKKGDDTISHLKIESRTIKRELDDLKEKLDNLITNEKSKLYKLNYKENIPLCEEKYKDAKEKYEEATGTVKLSKRSKKLNEYLGHIKKNATKKLKDTIINETNKKISQIIINESITIESIDRCLRLKNKAGASMGQTLAIAYSFLGSLFDNSTYQLPFVVDSPAGALDLEVRRHVSAILPSLFEQMIVFITSGEREGFTEYFYERPENVKFLTVKKVNNKVECIEGIDYFIKFQDTQEEQVS